MNTSRTLHDREPAASHGFPKVSPSHVGFEYDGRHVPPATWVTVSGRSGTAPAVTWGRDRGEWWALGEFRRAGGGERVEYEVCFSGDGRLTPGHHHDQVQVAVDGVERTVSLEVRVTSPPHEARPSSTERFQPRERRGRDGRAVLRLTIAYEVVVMVVLVVLANAGAISGDFAGGNPLVLCPSHGSRPKQQTWEGANSESAAMSRGRAAPLLLRSMLLKRSEGVNAI